MNPPGRSDTMDIAALQRTLREFAAERDWQPFHTPKNLAMALMVEAAELAEIFQWHTPEQSAAAREDTHLQQRAADEVADVLLYLLQIADHLNIDLKRAVGRKLVKNAAKHPPARPGASLTVAAEPAAPTHALVDWENVQPDETALRALVPGVSDAWVFHGPSQRGMADQFESFGERLTLVPIARSGKNALDFHLAFYMGYLAARQPGARAVVVSNDKGYGPMVEHAVSLGFQVTQVQPGLARPKAAPKRATAKKPAKPPAAARKVAATKAAPPAATAKTSAPPSVAAKSPSARKPPAPPQPKPAPAPKAASKSNSKPPSPKALPPSAPAPTVTAPQAPSPTAPSPKSAAPTSAAPKLAATKTLAPKPPAPKNPAPPPPVLSPLDRARAGLRAHPHPPARRASLSRWLRDHLGPTTDDATLTTVLAELEAQGAIAIDARGAVTYRL